MPILGREPDIFPADLLDDATLTQLPDHHWWCLYTISRREKELMRRLAASSIAHYGPIVAKRTRSPAGRIRTSYVPLFSNYVFLFATVEQRQLAMKSDCISQWTPIPDAERLVTDLRQIQRLVREDLPLTVESKIGAGDKVRIKAGPFLGIEGVVIRREGKTRLLVAVEYLNQGVSMDIDQALIEPN